MIPAVELVLAGRRASLPVFGGVSTDALRPFLRASGRAWDRVSLPGRQRSLLLSLVEAAPRDCAM